MKASIELNTPFLQQSHQQLTERSFTPDTGVRTGFVVFFSSSCFKQNPTKSIRSRHIEKPPPGSGAETETDRLVSVVTSPYLHRGRRRDPPFPFPNRKSAGIRAKRVDGIIHVQLLSVRIKEKTTISGTFEHILKNVFVKERMNDPP
jgi:hypothetical protein